MNHEVITQIATSTENVLNGKHGPFYAGLITLTTFLLGYLLIDNRYGISVGENSVRPQLAEPQSQDELL